MTNIQLYLAIGIPCFTILASLIISLVQWWGVKDCIREIREDIREIRSDIKLIVSKIAEMDNRLTLIEERVR